MDREETLYKTYLLSYILSIISDDEKPEIFINYLGPNLCLECDSDVLYRIALGMYDSLEETSQPNTYKDYLSRLKEKEEKTIAFTDDDEDNFTIQTYGEDSLI
jgi:hypothetical protein